MFVLPNIQQISKEHLQRMRLANRGRLLICAHDPAPFRTCKCSNVETSLSWTCHVSRLEFRTSLGISILLAYNVMVQNKMETANSVMDPPTMAPFSCCIENRPLLAVLGCCASLAPILSPLHLSSTFFVLFWDGLKPLCSKYHSSNLTSLLQS